MNELYIEESQEKIELLRAVQSVYQGEVCRVVAIREDVYEKLWIDAKSSSGLLLKDLLIGEDCEFTEAAMNYPAKYQKLLVY